MVEVAFVRSPFPHARVGTVDVSGALASDGVHAVVSARDFPSVAMQSTRHSELKVTPQHPLARERVRFVGEAVAAVVARDRYCAEDAVDLVHVEYEALPTVSDPSKVTAPLFDDIPDNVVFHETTSIGSPGEVFADQDLITVEHEVTLPRVTASPLEARGCIADFDALTGSLTFYASTQAPHRLARDLAAATGLREQQVDVIAMDVGGGFGQKIPTHMEEIAVALAALAVKRPVRWIEDRNENLVAAPQSRGQTVRAKLACDRAGRIVAMHADIVADAGAYSFNSGSALTEGYRTARAIPGPYAFEHFSYDVRIGLTNRSPVAPYRGVGFVAAQLARELLIDRAAAKLGLDRVEMRERNLVSHEQLPFVSCVGWTFSDATFKETLARVHHRYLEAEVDSGDRPLGIDDIDGPAVRGVGFSPFVEPCGIGTRGTEEVHGFPAPSHDSARISIDTSGTATVMFAAVGIGQGIETTMAQLAADTLGFVLDDVAVRRAGTRETPVSLTGTRASRSAVVTGGAVIRAGEMLKRALLESASKFTGVSMDSIRIRQSKVFVDGQDDARTTVREVVLDHFTGSTGEQGDERSLEATASYNPPATYSNASVIAVVDVFPRTGRVRVVRIFGAEDCGTVINPGIVEGQFIGASTQAIGEALIEAVRYSEEGQPLTATLMDYGLPTASDVPRVSVEHVESSSSRTIAGIRGVGESGMIGSVAAVTCAVADALRQLGWDGHELEIPLSPSVVWRTVERLPGDGHREQRVTS